MLRFTIRELVLVTVVVALGVSWWQERRRSASNTAEFQHRTAELQHRIAGFEKRIQLAKASTDEYRALIKGLEADKNREARELLKEMRAMIQDSVELRLRKIQEGQRSGVEPD
jgi:hypothetical protein